MTRFIHVAPEKGTPTLAGRRRPGDAISGGVTSVLYHTRERSQIPLPLCSHGWVEEQFLGVRNAGPKSLHDLKVAIRKYLGEG